MRPLFNVWVRLSNLCPKCDNFACLHTRQDQNVLQPKRWFFLPKLASSRSWSQAHLAKRIHAYTQSYSFGGRIILIICQIRHELNVTIQEISTSWKKTLNGGPYSTSTNRICEFGIFHISLSWRYLNWGLMFIHNWSLQSFSQDYDLASYPIHVVCVNFIHEWRNLQFNVHSERQIFWEIFHDNFYLLSEFLPEAAKDSLKDYWIAIFLRS